MENEICMLRNMDREQEVETKTLEDFKSYDYKTQCDLTDVYMKFYLEIIRIHDYVQIFQECVEKGKTTKQEMVAIIGTLEQVFRWQSLYLDTLKDVPKVQELKTWNCIQLHVQTREQKIYALINKVAQDLTL